MEEENFQKDLFQLDEPKKSFARLSDILPKADFEGKVAITFSLEKLVFMVIGVIMAMVVVYALGVENGKTAAPLQAQTVTNPTPKVSVPATEMRPAAVSPKNIFNTAPIATVVNEPKVSGAVIRSQIKAQAAAQRSKPFSILACTFNRTENAQAAAAQLSKQGYNVMVLYRKPYYQVCVGSYADKSSPEAQADIAKVRRKYKDAMFILR